MSTQSKLSAADIKKKLEGYTCVRPNQLKDLKPGDRIRYMINNEFRGGGAIKINKFPDYVVLMNVINKASWCMQIKDPTLKIWVKKLEKVTEEKDNMAQVYELFKQGKLVRKK